MSSRRPVWILAALLVILLTFGWPERGSPHYPYRIGRVGGHWLVQQLRPLTRPRSDRIEPPWTQASRDFWHGFTIEHMAPDRLRRRDYASSSNELVAISRPDAAPEPLAHLELSPTFKSIYDHLSSNSWTFQGEYHANLRKLLSENKTEKCGPWVGRYTEMHNRVAATYNDLDPMDRNIGITRSHETGRIVHSCQKVFGQCGGLADRFYGIAFTFLHALLLDRVYLNWWDPDYPILAEDMWRSPYINWAFNAPPHPWNASVPADPQSLGFHHVFETPPESDKVYTHASRDVLETERFPWETFTTQGNRGMLMRTLLEDPEENWQSRKLRDLGLTVDNAYGCVMNYLFDMLPHTRLLVEQYSALLSMPHVFSVSIQIRSGDQQIGSNRSDIDLNPFRTFFGCAAHAAAKFAKPGQHTDFVIFLVTDNYELSQAAPGHVEQLLSIMPTKWEHPTIPHFQPRVLTANIKPTHSEYGGSETDTKQHMINLSQHERNFNMQTSLMENVIQDAADIRIVCAWSGFGQLSSLRSGKGRTTIAKGAYGSDHDPPNDVSNISCGDDAAYKDVDEWAHGYKVA